jgi:hypothetical protein
MLGSWIGYCLTNIERSNTLELRAGFPSGNAPAERRCPSLSELLQELEKEHQSTHRYRGQTRRRLVCAEGRDNYLRRYVPHSDRLRIEFESLVPSFLRAVFRRCPEYPADWDVWAPVPILDQIAPAVRAVCHGSHEPARAFFRDVLHDLHLVALRRAVQDQWRLHLPETAIAPGTELPIRLLQFISLAQHYEYDSVMTDFTDSPAIAGWFASHHWGGALASGTGNEFGVIYRFDMAALNERLKSHVLTSSKSGAAISGTGLLGAADIGSIGFELGARPQAQRGGGLFGTEHALSALILSTGGGLTAFTFPRSSLTGSETPYSKADLCPPDDPLLAVFTPEGKKCNEAISTEELKTLLASVGADPLIVEMIPRCRSQGLI